MGFRTDPVRGTRVAPPQAMHLTTVDGDLLDQEVEAIVNAWNRNVIPWWLLLPQGVSGAIKRRAGTTPPRNGRPAGTETVGHGV